MRLSGLWRGFGAMLLAVSLLSAAARADVKLPAIISDHMVLEHDVADPIWGWAEPDEKVTVTLGNVTQTATADADGKWSVKLDGLQGPGPFTLTVEGKNKLTVSDVLVGEVWLCSGQSNMQWPVKQARDFDQEKAAADYPQIRMFTVGGTVAMKPQDDCQGSWKVCSPETVGDFSATAYFFGRELHQELGVPVGLINASVGGTPIEAWTSWDTLLKMPEMQELIYLWQQRVADYDPVAAKETYERMAASYPERAEKAKAEGKRPPTKHHLATPPDRDPHHPAVLFNGYIAPVVPYGIHGAIWYQGESNGLSVAQGDRYRTQLPALIKDWRTRWGQGDFPFAWVQLPNFKQGAGWPLVREGMLQALAVPNTGMTVNLDLGDTTNIHPANKQDIGHRLALWALSEVYGRKTPWSGPLFKEAKVEGDHVEITFTHTDGGLKASDGGELRGFTIAGADGKWLPAKATIDGDKLLVSSPEVKQPKGVRYAWDVNPEGNLTNGATGLPASPFRTAD